MTMSVDNSRMLWDRTLPKPSTLLPDVNHEAVSLRRSSLMRHHIVGDRFLTGRHGYGDDYARRSTVPYIPASWHSEHIDVHAHTHGANSTNVEGGNTVKTRAISVMSAEDTSVSSSPTATDPAEGPGQYCICQPDPHIPRPRNAFILYRQHHHAAVVAQHPGLPNPDISKIIGEQWRQQPEKVKDEWKALAEKEKARHSQQYPDYRYKPKRNGRFGRQSSTSGLPLTSVEGPSSCQKCGGKIMNAPQIPYTPVTPRAPTMPQMQARLPATQHVASPPHSARIRQYADMLGRPTLPTHDPRYQYSAGQQRSGQHSDGPESKKRRFNGDNTYSSNQPIYADQSYQQAQHDRVLSNAVPVGALHHRPAIGSTARNGYPNQLQVARPAHLQHRREPSLTLPPIKTPAGQQRLGSLASNLQTLKSGTQATVMSIPVLNKIRILSQISPYLAAPGSGSSPPETRGAIIAIEGMDQTSVYNMAHSLADQLEREGTFAVRIFGGPDPYVMLESTRKASDGQEEHLDVSNFLNVIGDWHKVSKEMQEYITTKPGKEVDSCEDEVMANTDEAENAQPEPTSDTLEQSEGARSPISAISPKTISQTAGLSLRSPPANAPIRRHTFEYNSKNPVTTQVKSRIPASALAQAQAQAEAQFQSKNKASADTTMTRPSASSEQTVTSRSSSAARGRSSIQAVSSQSPTGSNPVYNSNAVPIAIVPHYQLTTVDASSIAMPINDAYSPHSHWQWLATLWRGCIGPDVTIAIQSGDSATADDTDQPAPAAHHNYNHGLPGIHAQASSQAPPQSLAPSTGGPGTGPTAQRQPQSQVQAYQDVEVRLLDCRAVVVRAGAGSGGSGESWEKAKRRVGFEVEEFLRR